MPKEKQTDTGHQPISSAELERERLTSLINSMADGVIATDEEGKIVLYNGAALNVLDTNRTLTGESIDDVIKLLDKNGAVVDIKNLILETHTQQTSRDYHLEFDDESITNIYISIAPVRLSYGKDGKQGYVVLLRDITREKSLEEERDEFISVVSHELRTPIAIAEGNVGNAEFIVAKHDGLEEVREALKQAHEQILFLSGMINDLATLSRAERGKLNVEIEPIDAKDLIKELEDEYSPQAAQKGLEMKTEIDPKLKALHSSKLYVQEILQNFITNSIKYTEKGSITLKAFQKDNGVLFEVSDTGIGISKTDREKVFDKFFRSEDYRTKASSGTGLGLYVTLKLSRLLHAEIDLKSELNKGSTFSISIPNLAQKEE